MAAEIERRIGEKAPGIPAETVSRWPRTTSEAVVKIVEFAPTARAELDAAADRYELERPGRGQRFYAAVERAVKLIAAFPAAGPAFPDFKGVFYAVRAVWRRWRKARGVRAEDIAIPVETAPGDIAQVDSQRSRAT